jgi:cyclopropane fatty-acyl-phospholipid synthase-like methyltransferase
MSANTVNSWFDTWFDSKYYHILYKERDDVDAQKFINHLVHYLNVEPNAKVLDIACGRGRHALHLHQLGYDVTGIDLSENSINFAKQYETKGLRFLTQDKRVPLNETFDLVLNLFTSFGYFDNDNEHITFLKAIKAQVNEMGLAVIDFLNANYVKNNIIPEEIKVIEGIEFHIKRYFEDNKIIKDIAFEDQGEKFHFQEKVQAYELEDFEKLFESSDLYLLETFGDYNLNKYYKQTSDRLVMIIK